MENLTNEYKCGHTAEIVSYIYNEMPPGERTDFATHLASCMSCTDEFAAVADARFSVFEWHKEEFLNMPTPTFSIPLVSEPAKPIGFASSLEAIVRSAWALPTAAIVLLGIGFGFYVLSQKDTVDGFASTNRDPDEVAANSSRLARTDGSENVDVVAKVDVDDMEEIESPVAESTRSRPPTVVSAKRASSKTRSSKLAKSNQRKIDRPILSSYDEIEDKSLRLSDLLDGVGG